MTTKKKVNDDFIVGYLKKKKQFKTTPRIATKKKKQKNRPQNVEKCSKTFVEK